MCRGVFGEWGNSYILKKKQINWHKTGGLATGGLELGEAFGLLFLLCVCVLFPIPSMYGIFTYI